MSRRRVIFGTVLAISLVTVAILASGIVGQRGPWVPTMTVEKAPFRVRVTAEGNLVAARNTLLTAPMKPRVPFTVAWLVEDGTLVDDGEIVARFDASQLEKDLEDGLSDRRISDHKIGSAEVTREVTIDKLDQDAEIARQELEVAQEFQSKDDLVYSRIEIIESKIDTELAETRAGLARDSQAIHDQLSKTEIDLLSIERRKAEIKISQADDGLGALDLRAPHGGLVMLERDWQGNPVRVGDTIWPGRPLAKIPDLEVMQAEVFVLEADAGDLEVGQTATVWLDANPEAGYEASVKSIDPIAGRRNRRVPVQYFRTILELDRTDPIAMKPGSRVHTEIVIADLGSSITVPRQAVCAADGMMVVHRWARGGFEAVEVELGPAALGRLVVASGLEDGDVIALRDPTVAEKKTRGAGESSSGPTLPEGRQ